MKKEMVLLIFVLINISVYSNEVEIKFNKAIQNTPIRTIFRNITNCTSIEGDTNKNDSVIHTTENSHLSFLKRKSSSYNLVVTNWKQALIFVDNSEKLETYQEDLLSSYFNQKEGYYPSIKTSKDPFFFVNTKIDDKKITIPVNFGSIDISVPNFSKKDKSENGEDVFLCLQSMMSFDGYNSQYTTIYASKINGKDNITFPMLAYGEYRIVVLGESIFPYYSKALVLNKEKQDISEKCDLVYGKSCQFKINDDLILDKNKSYVVLPDKRKINLRRMILEKDKNSYALMGLPDGNSNIILFIDKKTKATPNGCFSNLVPVNSDREFYKKISFKLKIDKNESNIINIGNVVDDSQTPEP